MEEKDLKKAGIELFSNQPKVENVFCVVDNGEISTVMVVGTGVDLVNMLARAMVENSQVRKFFEKAYLSAVAHTTK